MIAYVRKALVAFVGATVTGLATAITAGKLGPGEIGASVGLGVAAAIGVFFARNAPSPNAKG